MTTSIFLIVLAAFYATHLLVEICLDLLNLRHINQHRHQVPPLFKDSFSPEEYAKSIDYTKSKTRFHIAQLLYGALTTWALILSGAFGAIDASLPHPLLYPLVIGLLLYALHLPFSIYSHFVLEERYGFNKTTPKVFAVDQIKSLLIGIALGLPLVALLFWLVDVTGDYWWVWGWASLMLFQLFTAAIFPVALAPIFYKFTPLPDGDLKDNLSALAKRLDFKMAGIFTIDGSKRSAHSNAFFAGLGKTRRIVLFDTLVTSLTQPEIIAVIAHEMGHNIKKHIQRGLVFSSLTTLIGFWVLAQCLKWPVFFYAFGVQTPSVHTGFVLFALFASVFTFPFTPLLNHRSRQNEYEADRFSVETTGDKASIISSLLKLSKDNLSNLTPHPWYSFFHYSHPTTTERAAAIEAQP